MSKLRILNEETGESQRKKIKLDKETLIKSTLKTNTNSDITNQEIENFLKIFSTVINQIENEGKSNNQVTDTERIKDILLTMEKRLASFYSKILIRLIYPR